MTQSSLDFDAPVPADPPARALETAPETLNIERMVKLLEQHIDYRVLRRPVPWLCDGPNPHGTDIVLGASGVHRVLVLGTETTGLSHPADKIIELAMLWVAVDTATGRPFGPVEVFEGPGTPFPPVAQEITGIGDDMVQGQRLDGATVARADLVVAHNAGFESP